jgi:hypothetical protein
MDGARPAGFALVDGGKLMNLGGDSEYQNKSPGEGGLKPEDRGATRINPSAFDGKKTQ